MPEKKKGAAARLDDTKFARNNPEFWTFLKFAFMSTLAAAVEFAAQLAARPLFKATGVQSLPDFFLFRWLERSTQPLEGYTLAMVAYAFMASTAVGYAVGYFLNRKTTFHADNNAALSTFFYVLLVVFTIAANSLIGPWLEADLLPRLGFVPAGLVPPLAKVLNMVATTVWVYPANRFIIHRKKKEVTGNA
jgi:putative flippase GtrA